VEDVFASPAVMLQAFGAPAPAPRNGSEGHFAAAAAAHAADPTTNRGGEGSTSGHGLDLPYVNALYTALLKVRRAAIFLSSTPCTALGGTIQL
jgi:hypothetical protein